MSQTTTMPPLFFPNVAGQAVFDAAGPRPQFLVDSARLTVVVAGLEPGQQIPSHPEVLAVYHFLAGEGVMTVDDAAFVADVTIPDGTEVVAGTTFVKIWRLRNSGTSTWGPGYTLEHVDGPAFGAGSVA
ncbi:MAG TPA: NBR1-Ig-like domain-containing protein, partial [Anaerolineae bacterium]|nr:NBR1-Ig-like domain-containing protein [Anaerolineae bacterium]